MTLRQRLVSRMVVCVAALAFGGAARAENWPTRPVKLLVPFAAGGNTDIIARLVADRLGSALPHSSFLVENQPGAGGITAMTQLARAPADGYTLMMAASPQLVIVPVTQHVAYDPAKDFTPVKIVASNPFVLVANSALPASTVPELIAYAKAQNVPFTYATGSLGSVSHLAAALMFSKAGVRATPVHYRGGAPAMNDVMAGHLPITFNNISEVLAQSGNPSLKWLAVSSARRAPQLPNVPTVEEGGIKDFDIGTWNGIIGPAGMPAEVSGMLEKALAEFVADPAARQKLISLGLVPDRGTGKDFAATIQKELPIWAEIVRVAGAKLDR